MKNEMGLMHWNHHNENSIISKIFSGILLCSFFLSFLFLYIRGIVSHEFGIIGAIFFGFILLFFMPFTLFGGINEIAEAYDLYKKQKNNQKE